MTLPGGAGLLPTGVPPAFVEALLPRALRILPPEPPIVWNAAGRVVLVPGIFLVPRGFASSGPRMLDVPRRRPRPGAPPQTVYLAGPWRGLTLSPGRAHTRGSKVLRTYGSKSALAILREENADIGAYRRPKTRGECLPGGWNTKRPCPFVGCPYHLFLEVTRRTGALRVNFPALAPGDLSVSCALDVADEGPHTLAKIGVLTGVTRERVRQVLTRTLGRLHEVSVDLEDLPVRGEVVYPSAPV